MIRIVNEQSRRFATVGCLVLAMLIPLLFVEGLTNERQQYFDAAAADIANAWGADQVLAGPFIVVPQIRKISEHDGNGNLHVREVPGSRVYLPEELALDINIEHQFRKRSIYEVPVYVARVQVSGTFLIPTTESSNVEVLFDEARVLVGLSHTQAISTVSDFRIGTKSASFASSTEATWLGNGIHANLPAIKAGSATEFAFDMEVKGSKGIHFTPIGKRSEVSMQATWPHPSFDGRYLPKNYTITPQGFTATWSIHELARNLPATWVPGTSEINLEESRGGLQLFQPTTSYTVIDRGIKYGILFIGLTFLTFICLELMTAIRFHLVQYSVVGAGLILFYLALLSLSEHISFVWAYVIATTVLSGLITWYVWKITQRGRMAAWVCTILVALYGCLYILLKLEAYSLLVGTAVLLLGLFALMWATKGLVDREEP